MLRDLQDIEFFRPIVVGDVVSSLAVALICGLIIAGIYRRTYHGTSYAPSFTRSMVVLPMITALVILVIGNSLARAFGLVGAMSIVRFRTAVKETHDIVIIFFTLAVGLAAGTGMFLVAWIGTFFVGVTVMVTARSGFGRARRNGMLLEFSYTPAPDPAKPSYQAIIDQFTTASSILSVRQTGEGDRVNIALNVHMKPGVDASSFVRQLGTAERVTGVSIYYDDEEL